MSIDKCSAVCFQSPSLSLSHTLSLSLVDNKSYFLAVSFSLSYSLTIISIFYLSVFSNNSFLLSFSILPTLYIYVCLSLSSLSW